MGLEIKQNLNVNLSQQLVITPQLQQAIKLLQLSHQELVEEIQEQMVENPALEIEAEPEAPTERDATDFTQAQESRDKDEPQEDQAAVVQEDGTIPEDRISEIDWEKYMDSVQDFHLPSTGVRADDDSPSFEANLTRSGTLSDHLEDQLRLLDLSETELGVALTIVYNLDDFGYLTGVGLDEIAESHEVDLETVERVLDVVQHLDPLGVAARDLAECLAIQAEQKFPGDEAMLKVIRDHLKDLERKNYSHIAKTLKIPLEEVYQIHRQVTELDPRPGRRFSSGETRYITPDIYIVKIGDRFEAVLNEDGLPRLRVSPYYRKALMDKSDREARSYIQDKLRSAAWLIRSIHQRQRTILKVTQSIIKFQREFLEKGINYLRPLILKDVADDIGMHESTISRVTANKYVHTPQGIFELKFFFNSGISRYHGDDIASESVKSKIKQIIQEEPPEKPYSDQKIVEILKAQNINIARRTVAKYREMLGILSSSKRKRMF